MKPVARTQRCPSCRATAAVRIRGVLDSTSQDPRREDARQGVQICVRSRALMKNSGQRLESEIASRSEAADATGRRGATSEDTRSIRARSNEARSPGEANVTR